MVRAPLLLVSSVCAFALIAAACDSTLNLGNAGDAAVDAGPDTAAPLTCVDTCARLIYTCHLLDPSQTDQCLSDCKGARGVLDLQCVQYTPCAAIPSACDPARGEGGVPGIDASVLDEFNNRVCQSACDDAASGKCISATDLTVCRDRCAAAPASVRENYTACSNSSHSDCAKHQACLELFVGKKSGVTRRVGSGAG